MLGGLPLLRVKAQQRFSDSAMSETAAPDRANLPFGSEFSPSQIDLPRLLELVEAHEGDEKAIEAAILVL